METVLQDLRYGIRMLRKSPGFVAVAVLSLALGIGANTVIFSIVDAVLLRPLPFRDSSRLAMVWERNTGRNRDRNVVGPANFFRWRERNHTFEEMAASIGWPANVNDSGREPERVLVGVVSPNLFSMLGVTPVLGRSFNPDEEEPAKGNVVVLSRGYWQRHYGGDASILGRTILISAQPATIIGVMPDWVHIPERVSMWQPFVATSERRTWDGRYLNVIARLKPGVALAQAQADMDVVSRGTREEIPKFNTGWDTNVVSLGEETVSDVRRALMVLTGAVLFVLLIACANMANLLLARATTREREIAVRLALGARRGRVVRQLLTESLLLGLAGGVAGLLIAQWSMRPLLAALPNEIPAFREIGINWQVLAFAAGISLLAGLIFGLAPALRVSAANPREALAEGGRSGGGGHRHLQVRNWLIVGEAGASFVLLAMAGLLVHSFLRLVQVNPGFDPAHVLTMQVSLPGSKYEKPERQAAYYQDALRRVRALPGVEVASAITWLPLDGGSGSTFTVDDRPAPRPGEEPVGDIMFAMEDYFRAMSIPLLRGRSFDPALDHPDDPVKKLVINDTMAQALWPGQDPIGKRVSMNWGSVLHGEVIGVVRTVKLYSLSLPIHRSQLYWYMPQQPSLFMSFAVRTGGDPMAAAATVRGQIASVDREQPIAAICPMNEVVDRAVRQPRFITTLLGGFATLALLLAGMGIYGVISYSVTQRTREFGVRMALGALHGDILRLVIVQALRLVSLGLAVGIVVALLVTRLMSTLLFGVKPGDPVTLLAGCALLLATTLMAGFIPARRAARIHPMEALRYE